jgi:hypothetical protein
MTTNEKEKMIADIIRLLLNIYIIMLICLLHFVILFIAFFNAVTSIIGIILAVYLYRTRQLAISKKIVFLIPHVVFFGIVDVFLLVTGFFVYLLPFSEKGTWSFYDAYSVAYTIVKFGLPFLLYCFLQIPHRFYAIVARILCFILPILTILGFLTTLEF